MTSALTVGWFGVEIPVVKLGRWAEDGNVVTISDSGLWAATLTETKVLAQQIMGLVDNRDQEPAAHRVLVDSLPEKNGWYRVTAASVDYPPGVTGTRWVTFTLTMEKLRSFASARIENRLGPGAVRPNTCGIVTAEAIFEDAVPVAGKSYTIGGTAITRTTRPTADGASVKVYRNAALANAVASWWANPQDALIGACRAKMGTDLVGSPADVNIHENQSLRTTGSTGLTHAWRAAPTTGLPANNTRMKIGWAGRLDDWTPAVEAKILADWRDTVNPALLYATLAIGTDGKLNYYFTDSLGAVQSAISTVAVGATDGQFRAVMVEHEPGSDRVRFWTALQLKADGSETWTQLGANVALPAGKLRHATPGVSHRINVSGSGVGTGNAIAARVDKVWMAWTAASAGGSRTLTPDLSVDFTDWTKFPSGGLTGTDSTGAVWTLTSSGGGTISLPKGINEQIANRWTVIGDQVPNLPNGWHIDNGLVRVMHAPGLPATSFPNGEFLIGWWIGDRWWYRLIDLGWTYNGGHTITVLVNRPEMVVVRISDEVAGGAIRTDLDIAIRRGSRMVDFYASAPGTSNAFWCGHFENSALEGLLDTAIAPASSIDNLGWVDTNAGRENGKLIVSTVDAAATRSVGTGGWAVFFPASAQASWAVGMQPPDAVTADQAEAEILSWYGNLPIAQVVTAQ